MAIEEKEYKTTTSVDRSTEAEIEDDDGDHSSISSLSTDSQSSSDEIQSIHQSLSRNAGLEEGLDKGGLAAITTVTTNMTTDPRFEVDFEGADNPQEWDMKRKSVIIFFMSFSTLVVVMYSTSYTAGIPGMMRSFGIHEKTPVVLGVTLYLFGLALGSIVLAPLSEIYGRRPVYLIAVFCFLVLIIPCALAKDLATILVVRFFGAIAGSAMISNAPGTVSDIIQEEWRALAFSIWSIGPMNGPVVGPIVGGFVFQYMGWRWTNWVVMIGSGVAWGMVWLVPETYAPAILRAKSAKKRKETGEDRWYSRYDEKKAFWPMLKENLIRPVAMGVKEPICIFWNVYIALVYALLYLCFVSYPIVFSELRGWSPGMTGLAYCGIGVGGAITVCCEPLIRRFINSHAPDPSTGKPPPESMISIVCIAAFLCPIGEMIFAWTCTPNVHWIAPIIAGIPFGAGNNAIFIYGSNYLIHSYGIYAASALAGNAVLRSVVGGVLPLAGPQMYATLGPHWSGTMLSLIEFAIVPIPLVFYRYGHKIRSKSALIRRMREDREKLEARLKKAAEREQRAKAREGTIGGDEKKEMEV
ncbi:MFS general substrate transporter [Aaosphaeria arxii CBS 175.79]|uniref:MFS general substrate transporter n=1 Tax=Aaosphaeria arxii CBS 175.79 TaxID=1450172 RepID=A0A6A5Y5U6_9PLEO|nr:MFS general substrate transporter [Aaosphaeria arxii CBS 175.79]KAF2020221.1 MFS general substrate transporter [Aaosphaeria arxii CBS 175.79]